MGPERGHSLQQGNSVKLLDSDAIGPLRGPIRFLLAIPPAIVSNHSNPIGAAVSLMTFIRHDMPDICQTLAHEVKRNLTGIDLTGSSEGGDNTGSLPHRHA